VAVLRNSAVMTDKFSVVIVDIVLMVKFYKCQFVFVVSFAIEELEEWRTSDGNSRTLFVQSLMSSTYHFVDTDNLCCVLSHAVYRSFFLFPAYFVVRNKTFKKK
jgi:hypothetical protein